MCHHVIGLGEVLWDVLPDGKRLGGAPANFACHARALGAEASVVSAVGADPAGRELLRALDERGFDTATVSRDLCRPSGTVTVEMGAGGQPRYTIHEGVAWDHLQPTEAATAAVRDAEAICFGTLAQRHPVSRAAIRRLVEMAPPGALRVFDVNLRQDYHDADVIRESLEIANVVKLNEDELPVVSDAVAARASAVGDRERLQVLVETFDLRAAALTRGAAGSLLLAGGQWSESGPDDAIEVRDTIGAGDAFLAAFVMGLLEGHRLDRISRLANDLARFVCTCEGATPALPGRFRDAFRMA